MNMRLLARSALGLLTLSCLLTPGGPQAQTRRVPMFACGQTDARTTFQDRPCSGPEGGHDGGLRWVVPEPLHAGDAQSPPRTEPRQASRRPGQPAGRRARQAKRDPVTPSEPIALTSHRHGRRPFGLPDNPPTKKSKTGKRDPNRRVAKAPDVEPPARAGANGTPGSGETRKP